MELGSARTGDAVLEARFNNPLDYARKLTQHQFNIVQVRLYRRRSVITM